jgi:hypothetical protein
MSSGFPISVPYCHKAVPFELKLRSRVEIFTAMKMVTQFSVAVGYQLLEGHCWLPLHVKLDATRRHNLEDLDSNIPVFQIGTSGLRRHSCDGLLILGILGSYPSAVKHLSSYIAFQMQVARCLYIEGGL